MHTYTLLFGKMHKISETKSMVLMPWHVWMQEMQNKYINEKYKMWSEK